LKGINLGRLHGLKQLKVLFAFILLTPKLNCKSVQKKGTVVISFKNEKQRQYWLKHEFPLLKNYVVTLDGGELTFDPKIENSWKARCKMVTVDEICNVLDDLRKKYQQIGGPAPPITIRYENVASTYYPFVPIANC